MISLKNSGTGTYASILGMVCSAAAMASYMILSADGEKSPSIVYTLTIASIIVQLLVLLFSHTENGKQMYNHSSILSVLLVGFAFEKMMVARVEWLGAIAAHNASAAPMHPAFIVTVGLYVASLVISVIAGFGRQVRS